jgi:hypothetical protein
MEFAGCIGYLLDSNRYRNGEWLGNLLPCERGQVNALDLGAWCKPFIEVAEEVEKGCLVDAYVVEKREIDTYKGLGLKIRYCYIIIIERVN